MAKAIAGSFATVARAWQDDPKIGAVNRIRVLAEAARQGYRPNPALIYCPERGIATNGRSIGEIQSMAWATGREGAEGAICSTPPSCTAATASAIVASSSSRPRSPPATRWRRRWGETLRDIRLHHAEGPGARDATMPVDWNDGGYPGPTMFGGVLPARGLLTREVEDLVVENLRVVPDAEDARPEVVRG